jgi:hypothetical protein
MSGWVDEMKWHRAFWHVLLALTAIIVVGAVLSSVQVCRDWAFVCENTGSRKGHRKWTFGPTTGYWYEKSPLEQFIESQQPDALVHRWTSYSGIGKNAFGRPVLHGHGRPGTILQLNHDILRQWIAKQDPATVLEFYDLLVSDDEAAIKKRITSIWEEVMHYEE